ncbi:hypothetical protein JI739_23030 [Ramlibacter sp. AW1]|uniref:Uncharacterized protein n=1 Tax=Ramlibacter aurantiacus TaxID=2801330 RepID=A0A937D3Z4_9BURK|nr:hypothetical protein [Ramlibacter aurantiacus]MBL0423229.1 hypothetical protein [Ramlibacter aurantiacus]
MNAEAYLQSAATLDIWDGLTIIKKNQNNPVFRQMLASGNWSPAAFCAQHKLGPSKSIRITNKRTDLNGVLPCAVDAGRMVVLKMQAAAKSSAGYFSYCSADNFTMNFLTLVVDKLLPGVRRLPDESGCPFSHQVQRPLY